MTDTSSSAGNAPSPVVCPLAKLGRLSPSAAVTARISSHRCFKTASSVESLNYCRTSDIPGLGGGGVNKNNEFIDGSPSSMSPVYRCYQEVGYRRSPIHQRSDHFYQTCDGHNQKHVEDPNPLAFFQQQKKQQTSLGCYTSGKTSPYLDQGMLERV